MKLELFLSILSTQVYFNFDQYITLKGLFESPDDFINRYRLVMSSKECERIECVKAFDQVYKIYNYCNENRIQIWYPGHPSYPDLFLKLSRPPLFLSLKGQLPTDISFLSIVGSRNPSSRVLSWMNTYLPEIVKHYGVISGAARGVDQMAHKMAIRGQKPTIAFLPSGLSAIYPSDFSKWQDAILENGGGLISEYHPFQQIRPAHFAERNRMIACLGLIVLICEAQLRSGSYMTARLAIENSKTLCVLPSFPSDISNAGGLNLLFQGAFPIRDDKDILVLLEAEKIRCHV